MIDRFGYFKISDMSGSMGPSAAELDKSSTPVTMGGTDWLAAGRYCFLYMMSSAA